MRRRAIEFSGAHAMLHRIHASTRNCSQLLFRTRRRKRARSAQAGAGRDFAAQMERLFRFDIEHSRAIALALLA